MLFGSYSSTLGARTKGRFRMIINLWPPEEQSYEPDYSHDRRDGQS